MRRRAFITGAIFTISAAPAVGQQTLAQRRLAIFSPFETVAWMRETDGKGGYPALFAELRRRGWVEGVNLAVQRYGREQNAGDLAALAAEAARGAPDVIFTIGPGVFDMKTAAAATPLVTFTYDPIALGLTQSLSHPGGNLTGISVDTGPTIWGKRIELLREIFPALSKLAFLALKTPAWERFLQPALTAACDQARLPLLPVLLAPPVGDTGYREAVAGAARDGANAIMVAENPETVSGRVPITEAAAAARLPAMYATRDFVDAGGLMAYVPDFAELNQRVAADIDAILRGAKPGDIPYFQGTKFDLLINRKTAAALGLTIPPLLLARADEVIE
jgi:putative ABC transport system substrate-binding protein